jgi:hypothetical protein
MNRVQHTKAKKPSQNDRLIFREHSLAEGEHIVHKQNLLQAAQKAKSVFPEKAKSIETLIKKCDPIQMLSTLAFYGLLSSARNDFIDRTSLIPTINPQHVEILQAFMLSVPPNEWGTDLANPAVIQTLIDDITDLADSFIVRRFEEIEQERNQEESTILHLQENLRMYTQVVRNWGHLCHVIEVATGLYGKFDDKIREVHGLSFSEATSLFKHLIRSLEQRSTERLTMLAKVKRERTPQRMMETYYTLNSYLEGTSAEFLKNIPVGHIGKEEIMAIIMSHSDLQLPFFCEINVDTAAAELNFSPDAICKFLSAISYSPNYLAHKDKEHFFMANPIWEKPIIRMGERDFFCPMPLAFFTHVHRIMNKMLDDLNLKELFEKHRASFLETQTQELFRKYFPKAKIASNIELPNAEGETDLLVQEDSVLFIVEAKAGNFTVESQRGAPKRMKRDIEELIISPSLQSERMEKIILAAQDGEKEALSKLSHIKEINFTAVQKIIRLSVTLYDISSLQAAENEFKEAGWLDREHLLAPNVTYSDLLVLFEILKKPYIIAHYFSERFRIQRIMTFYGDEIDFLGLYLKTLFNFNFAAIEKEKPTLIISELSEPIDQYYQLREFSTKAKAPLVKLTPLWESVLNGIENRAFTGWMRINLILLQVPYDTQKTIGSGFRKICLNVRKNWRKDNHECCVILTPPDNKNTAIMFFAYPQKLFEERHQRAQQAASEYAFKESYIDFCLAIGKNIDIQNEPYSFLFLMHRELVV